MRHRRRPAGGPGREARSFPARVGKLPERGRTFQTRMAVESIEGHAIGAEIRCHAARVYVAGQGTADGGRIRALRGDSVSEIIREKPFDHPAAELDANLCGFNEGSSARAGTKHCPWQSAKVSTCSRGCSGISCERVGHRAAVVARAIGGKAMVAYL